MHIQACSIISLPWILSTAACACPQLYLPSWSHPPANLFQTYPLYTITIYTLQDKQLCRKGWRAEGVAADSTSLSVPSSPLLPVTTHCRLISYPSGESLKTRFRLEILCSSWNITLSCAEHTPTLFGLDSCGYVSVSWQICVRTHTPTAMLTSSAVYTDMLVWETRQT